MMDSTAIITFGKYKGQPASVLLSDQSYCEWVVAQPGIVEKHPDVIEFICHGDSTLSETPVHNALQSKFMDGAFCSGFASHIYTKGLDIYCQSCTESKDKADGIDTESRSYNPVSKLITSHFMIGRPITFEWNGFDVLVGCETVCTDCFTDNGKTIRVAVEVKPSIGDDYPAILRQIMTARRIAVANRYHQPDAYALVTESFSSKAITLDQAKFFFRSSGVLLVTLDEIMSKVSA